MTPREVDQAAARVLPLLREGSTATIDEIGQRCLDEVEAHNTDAAQDMKESAAVAILMLARGMLDDELYEPCACCGR